MNFTFCRTTISDILKNKNKFVQFMKMNPDEQEENFKRRRALRKTVHKELENKLFEWYNELRLEGTYVSGPMIATKAQELHKELGYSGSFTASNGWLDRFKLRNGIKLCGLREVKHETDSSAVEPFRDAVETLIGSQKLSHQQIYNADEFDLFWKMTPNPESDTNEVKSSVRAYRERITVLACTNALGNHKLPLVCVGRGKISRSFTASEQKNLPAIYFSQETAWMDRNIFRDWFFDHFVPSVKQHLKSQHLPETAVLFIDCSNAHPSNEELQTEDGGISCHFFPKNVKNEVQPMQQGMVTNLKRYYRKNLLIEAINNGLTLHELQKKTTLNDAIHYLASSWSDKISEDLVQKCFSHLIPTLTNSSDYVEDELISIPAFENLIHQFPECTTYPMKRIMRWLNCDEVDHQMNFNENSMIVEEIDDDMTDGQDDEVVFLDFENSDSTFKIEKEGCESTRSENEPTTSIVQHVLVSGEDDDDFIDDQIMLHEEIAQNVSPAALNFGYDITATSEVSCIEALVSLKKLLVFMENDSESLYKDVKMLQELKQKLEKRIS